jgi:hypothetical protein
MFDADGRLRWNSTSQTVLLALLKHALESVTVPLHTLKRAESRAVCHRAREDAGDRGRGVETDEQDGGERRQVEMRPKGWG